MKKIFYWSPHISNVATIKNVINSAISIKKFSKEQINVSILDVAGEWEKYKENFQENNIDYFKVSKLNLAKFIPISGFFKSRLLYLIIFFLKISHLKKILDREKPDYLIIHLITIIPLLLLYFFKFDTKFILRISGFPKLTIFRKFLWRAISKKIFLITCPSVQTQKNMIAHHIFPEEKIKILYDPILNVKQIKNNIKNKLDENLLNKKYFLNIGRLTLQKNQILLINAFSKVLKNNNDLSLYIAGEGERKNKLQNLIKQKKLEKNVFLLGHVENIFPLIKNSLAVISTSLWEDPGAVMVEAAFCGKIVISSNCPNGPEEFLENDKGGYLFKNNDINDLENKINSFLNDSQQIKLKKKVILKKNSKKYSLFCHYQKLNQILK